MDSPVRFDATGQAENLPMFFDAWCYFQTLLAMNMNREYTKQDNVYLNSKIQLHLH